MEPYKMNETINMLTKLFHKRDKADSMQVSRVIGYAYYGRPIKLTFLSDGVYAHIEGESYKLYNGPYSMKFGAAYEPIN